MKIDIEQLEFINKKLREIVLAIEARFGEKTITSLFRIGDTGVHGQLPLRGIDLSCNTHKHGELVETWVNERWCYDFKRPEKKCCLFHLNKTNPGYHIHLQVHQHTRKRQ